MSREERASALRATITEALIDYFKDKPRLKVVHISSAVPDLETSDPEFLNNFDASNVFLDSTSKAADGSTIAIFSALRTDETLAKMEYETKLDLVHIVTAYVIANG